VPGTQSPCVRYAGHTLGTLRTYAQNDDGKVVAVFSVMFEVHPKEGQYRAYLDHAKMLRPELQQIDGFVDNVRYHSLGREGWILSLSGWRDEKALVRWRTQAKHLGVQEQGRFEIFVDYHLRVGQITEDTQLPDGCELLEQRLDETEIGEGTTAVLVSATRGDAGEFDSRDEAAAWLGLDPDDAQLAFWDVYDAVLSPGDMILQTTWRDEEAASAFAATDAPAKGARVRQVRIIRDYSMYDRRETPQYYAEVESRS
jgi:heme-degrading monooxygenase HmoA